MSAARNLNRALFAALILYAFGLMFVSYGLSGVAFVALRVSQAFNGHCARVAGLLEAVKVSTALKLYERDRA